MVAPLSVLLWYDATQGHTERIAELLLRSSNGLYFHKQAAVGTDNRWSIFTQVGVVCMLYLRTQSVLLSRDYKKQPTNRRHYLSSFSLDCIIFLQALVNVGVLPTPVSRSKSCGCAALASCAVSCRKCEKPKRLTSTFTIRSTCARKETNSRTSVS